MQDERMNGTNVSWMRIRPWNVFPLILGVSLMLPTAPRADDQATSVPRSSRSSIARETSWTNSRIVGSPEPPTPYRVERVYSKLQFFKPVAMKMIPGTSRWIVPELTGNIFSFPHETEVREPDLVINLAEHIHTLQHIYDVTFHPDFEQNRQVFICYLVGKGFQGDAWVSRFTLRDTNPPQIDPSSEERLLKWFTGGHNGGCLEFGPDRYLYISTGDGGPPSPPDIHNAGQDLSDFKSTILRIDVDQRNEERPYGIPADNPFVELDGALPEIWAYGLRNPWKMTFDEVTDELWIGDVGWELWEMVFLGKSGANYGWSLVEGGQPIRLDLQPGPTPIVEPIQVHPRNEFRSLTGGYVYRGELLSDLVGAYIYGDYVTGVIWGLRHENGKVTWAEELANTSLKIIAFAQDHDQELYVVDYEGAIYRLVPNLDSERNHEFPRRLSETGLFESIEDQTLAPGVYPYTIQVEQWAGGASAERLLGLPGTSSVTLLPEPRLDSPFSTPRWMEFPPDAVLVKTLSLEMEMRNPSSRQKVETQILHHDTDTWRGYTYRWNDEQSDAFLVAAEGDHATYEIRDDAVPGGKREQTWEFPSRAQCMRCHTGSVGHVLAFSPSQLQPPKSRSSEAGPMSRLLKLGLVVPAKESAARENGWSDVEPLVALDDPSADLHQRARSYLHVNCAHCHHLGASGTTLMDLRFEIAFEQSKILDVEPLQGTFGMEHGRIVSSGDPYRSVLLYRMAKLGRGRMPQDSSERIDSKGLQLIHNWIRQLDSGGDSERASSSEDLLADLISAADHSTTNRKVDRIGELLDSTDDALALAMAMHQTAISSKLRREVLAMAKERAAPAVHDLFEPLLPPNERKTHTREVSPDQILQLQGDRERGRVLFHNETLQCIRCHQVDGHGGKMGPDLTAIGGKSNKAQLLEDLLQPSSRVDAKFVSYVLQTKEGLVLQGLLRERTGTHLHVVTAEGQEVRVANELIEDVIPLGTSLMPEGLLSHLSPMQIADLLEYLQSRR